MNPLKGESCYCCDADMRGRWSGARGKGRRRICLRCNEAGVRFTADGKAIHIPPTYNPRLDAIYAKAREEWGDQNA